MLVKVETNISESKLAEIVREYIEKIHGCDEAASKWSIWDAEGLEALAKLIRDYYNKTNIPTVEETFTSDCAHCGSIFNPSVQQRVFCIQTCFNDT